MKSEEVWYSFGMNKKIPAMPEIAYSLFTITYSLKKCPRRHKGQPGTGTNNVIIAHCSPKIKGVQNVADKPAEMPEHFSLYTTIPTSLFFRRDITDSQKMLYGLLACMADLHGYAFPRNSTLQRYLGGVSHDTVSRRLKALEDAGVIKIEGGEGGPGIRKIRVVGEDFSNLRNSAYVEDANLRKSAEGIQLKNKKIKSNNKAKASEEEICDWISKWCIQLGYERELTTGLIADFFAFADSRKAKGKPFLTIRAVSMQANKLVKNAGAHGTTEAAARMRYMLRSSITHNWEEVYPIDARTEPDFWLWAGQEYGISRSETDGSTPERMDGDAGWL